MTTPLSSLAHDQREGIRIMLELYADSCGYDVVEAAKISGVECTPAFAAGILIDCIGPGVEDGEREKFYPLWANLPQEEKRSTMLEACSGYPG